MFGSEAWVHILDEKKKTFRPKVKYIFVGYFEDVKGYRLLQPSSNEIIIMRVVKFDENLSACKTNSVFVSSSPIKFFVSDPILISSLDDDSENGNPRFSSHLPLVVSIEHEFALTPLLSRWVLLSFYTHMGYRGINLQST
jgi:hypothetical protein